MSITKLPGDRAGTLDDRGVYGESGKHGEGTLGPAWGGREDALEQMTPKLSLERGEEINQMTEKKKKQTAGSKDTRVWMNSAVPRMWGQRQDKAGPEARSPSQGAELYPAGHREPAKGSRQKHGAVRSMLEKSSLVQQCGG